MKPLTIAIIIILSFSISYAEDIPQSFVLHLKDEISLIAVDPGFGGPILGPTGCDGKIFSKNINLKISFKVAEKIREDLGLDVVLTRETDEYIALEERTAIANTKGADLFISIHMNGFSDQNVSGVETYCLNLVVNDGAIAKAAKEITTDQENIEDMNAILSALMQNIGGTESMRLSDSVYNRLVAKLASQYDNIIDRGVKNAPFYEFLGASMPSIMVMPSFITNQDECNRLTTDEYQEAIAEGIVLGLRKYLSGK